MQISEKQPSNLQKRDRILNAPKNFGDTITHALDQKFLRALLKGWELRKTRRRHNAKELSCQMYL